MKALEEKYRSHNFHKNDSLTRLEICIHALHKEETISASYLTQSESSLNDIKECIKSKPIESYSYLFLYNLIEADLLYIEAFYIHQTILTIANNINAYLRDDTSFTELKIEHLENFNPEEFQKTFRQDNIHNKNRKIAQNLFNILVEILNKYKLTNEKIKNILHSIE